MKSSLKHQKHPTHDDSVLTFQALTDFWDDAYTRNYLKKECGQ